MNPSQKSSTIQTTPIGHPIFIHCLPRVGSTWFGYKFDDLPEVAYRFEPFHENLIAGTYESLQHQFENLRHGESLRHPFREAHYHKDYRFQPQGGVALFQKRFCYENYYMEPDQQDDEMRSYVFSLIKEACRHNKTPCIKSTRSALRAEWMAHHFLGIHLYIFRNPRLIDNSHFSYRGFFNRYIRDYGLIVGQNRDHPVFSELAKWSGIDYFSSKSIEDDYTYYSKLFRRGYITRYDRQYHFDCLCFFWTVGLAQATRYADLIIDMDMLLHDSIRHDTEIEIRNMAGLKIDLSDYYVDEIRIRRIFRRHQMTISTGMVDIIRNALSYIKPDWGRALTFTLSNGTEDAIQFFGGRHRRCPGTLFRQSVLHQRD